MGGVIFLFFLGGIIVVVRYAQRSPYSGIQLSRKTKLSGYGVFHPAKLQRKDEAILLKYCPFYQSLTVKQRLKFQARLMKFISIKHFEPKKRLVLSNEMVILIAASAVQLTFGITDYRFLHFERIIIYPEKFFNNQMQRYHLGETNNKGWLVFSWKHLLKGYQDAHDNIHLGLHEFSHALFLNHVVGKKEDWHFSTEFENWKKTGSRDFFHLKKNDSSYLRPYAKANFMEFFAVCVECFFETPHLLQKHHPSIYLSIKKLLKLDPAKTYNKRINRK